mmetsp:Transcript_34821/g.42968  ORF Transcript_34821/g.42968 Transcript_34821/m.42968 type:complete len:146 (+) Transcript_34821:221-658(+)
MDSAYNSPLAPFETCPNCARGNRTRHYGIFKGKYHEYRKTSKDYRKPDIVLAFEVGIHETKESWIQDLELIKSMKVPFCLSWYSVYDYQMDGFCLLMSGLKYLVNPTLNPFRSLHDMIDMNPDMESDKCCELFYSIQKYFAIMQG